MRGTARLEAFSDGVIAVIITILVLESISLPGVSRLETPPTEPSDPERED